jgi:hypothetical protein
VFKEDELVMIFIEYYTTYMYDKKHPCADDPLLEEDENGNIK